MPSKRGLVTSEICFGTEKVGLLDFSYNKCALRQCKNDLTQSKNYPVLKLSYFFPHQSAAISKQEKFSD